MNWTQQQIVDLKQHFPIKPDGEVATIIGKSPNALRIKAFRLGIRKQTALIRDNLELNDTEKQFIIGGLLGDLHCRISRTSINPCLEGGHCAQQKDYLLWKIGLVPRLGFKLRGSKQGSFFYGSKNFRALLPYYQSFYQKGVKLVTRDILDQLNELGLLIWYLDDGSYHKRDNNLLLYTNCFSLEEQSIICEWFLQKYGVCPKIVTIQKSISNKQLDTRYYIRFNVKDSQKLLELFSNFEIPRCMDYKLGRINITLHHLNEVGIESCLISG